MFGKKKEINSISMVHYEGLPNFQQDSSCIIIMGDNQLMFQSHNGNIVNLPYDRIVKVDAMPEVNFMARYHNNKAKTKHGTVWFRIITYTSQSGEEKYIALWEVSLKVMKFFDQLEMRIRKQPTTITL